MSEPGNRPRSVEFKLKSTSSSRALHNIMILFGNVVKIDDFTTPVRLIRDSSSSPLGNMATGGEELHTSRSRKTRSRLIMPGGEDESDHEEDEEGTGDNVPWLLEDFDGQHSYIGSMIDPASKYVIFINQGNEFRVVLVNKWYRFYPKPTYIPLTLEEAEEQMANKGRNEDFDRWLMKKRGANSPQEDEPTETHSTSGTIANLSHREAKVSTRFVRMEEESFDYVEHFDDDEGTFSPELEGVDTDPTMPSMFSPPGTTKKLTDAGKEMQRIMKSLGAEIGEDENHHSRSTSTLLGVDHNLSRPPTKHLGNPNQHHPISSVGSVIPSAEEGISRSNVINDADVVNILRNGPLHIRDLISKLKDKLKADPRNKDLLREIVRRVAVVKGGSTQGDEKLLELKQT